MMRIKEILMSVALVFGVPTMGVAETIHGLWANKTTADGCEKPSIDVDGRMAFLDVTDLGFFHGKAEMCQFPDMLPSDTVSISGYMTCLGQAGAFQDFYEITLNEERDVLTFTQGIGSARFVLDLQRCEKRSPDS